MTALIVKPVNLKTTPISNFNEEKLEALKATYAKNLTNEEMMLFFYVCKHTGLDPSLRQIYPVKRPERQKDGSYKEVMTIQVGIDGYRLIAERTGRYSPGKEPVFKYDNDGKLLCATSYVKKQTNDGTWHEVSSTAFYSEYVQTSKDGSPTRFWKQMGHNQLAKCAEALALKKAFPGELSGLYSHEEMQQAGDGKVIEVLNEIPETQEDAENLLIGFLEEYPEIDRSLGITYMKKYSTHWNKTISQSIEDYQDREKFLLDFGKWKAKEEKKSQVA